MTTTVVSLADATGIVISAGQLVMTGGVVSVAAVGKGRSYEGIDKG